MNNVGPLQNVPNDPAIVQVREVKVSSFQGSQKYHHCNKYRCDNSYTKSDGCDFDIIAALVVNNLLLVSRMNNLSEGCCRGTRVLELLWYVLYLYFF